MMLRIITVSIVIATFNTSGFSQITRAQMLATAQSYRNFQWMPNTNCVEQKETAENPTSSTDPRRINFYRAAGYSGIQQTGMAYAWSCWSTLQVFTQSISLGNPADVFQFDCSSDAGTTPRSYDILMGSRNNYSFNLTNNGTKTIAFSLTEKFSGKQLVRTTTIFAGQSGSLSGPSGNGYTQTLVLDIKPFFLNDPISWSVSTSCWGRPAEQTRYSSGAYSAHWPNPNNNPQMNPNLWAVGIDCSGLISRAWNLASKLSTTQLFNNYSAVTQQQLGIGDIVVNPGVHVVFVSAVNLPNISYIHSCDDGVVQVNNVNLQTTFLNNGYFLRSFFTPPTSVDSTNLDTKITKIFELLQNYPNPFNPSTVIRFTLPKRSLISLTIYDARGSLVRELATRRPYDTGEGELVWNGTNAAGQSVASGAYFYRLTAEGLDNRRLFSQTKKLLLVR